MAVTKTTVPCCVCDATDHALLYEDELGDRPALVDYDFKPETRLTYRIVACQKCGHVFTNPMPHITGEYEDCADPVYLATRRQREKTAAMIVGRIRSHVAKGTWLDIGCNIGLLLNAAAPYFETYGVEPSNWARGRCDSRHRAFASVVQAPKMSYDVISLIGVIEHFEDPSEIMAFVGENLAPGGVAALYTGDREALVPRLLGKKWWWYQGMHLHYFSKRTLGRLLAKHGMEAFSASTMPVYFEPGSLAKSLNRYAIGRLFSPLLTIPALQSCLLPVKISGEMLLLGRKKAL